MTPDQRQARPPVAARQPSGPRCPFVPKGHLSGSGPLYVLQWSRGRSSTPAPCSHDQPGGWSVQLRILLGVVGRSPVGVRLSPVELTLGPWPRVSLNCPSGQPLRHGLRCLAVLGRTAKPCSLRLVYGRCTAGGVPVTASPASPVPGLARQPIGARTPWTSTGCL